MAKFKAKKENFNLTQFKLKDGKGIINYSYLHDENPHKEIREYNSVKIPLLIHDDLKSLLNQLREYVLKEYYIEPTPENLMQVRVNSIKIENRLCVIGCEFDTLHGGTVNLTTSKIMLDESHTELESEIDAILDSIITEVYDYIFNCKTSAPELFEEVEESKVVSGLNGTLQKVS